MKLVAKEIFLKSNLINHKHTAKYNTIYKAMNDLAFYFKEGWQHIISTSALDHQLFMIALTAVYLLKDYKKLLILITAFTIGHSLTLALSVYNVIRLQNTLVEFLIPCTIIITAMYNLTLKHYENKNIKLNYLFALFFGLIHGLGFANTIRFMLAKDQTIGWSLFGFNIGLEVGQIIVVSSILLIAYLVVNICKLKQKWWVVALSTIALLWAIKIALERFP